MTDVSANYHHHVHQHIRFTIIFIIMFIILFLRATRCDTFGIIFPHTGGGSLS